MINLKINKPITWRYFLSTLLLLVSVIGCSVDRAATYPIETLPFSGRYTHVIWFGNDLIVQNSERPFLERLWRVSSDGTDMMPLVLPEQYPDCIRTGFQSPIRLIDEQLAYLRSCQRSSGKGDLLFPMAYDFDTGIVTQLTEGSFPKQVTPTGTWSWKPSEQKGVASDGVGRGLGEQLFWFTSEQWQYFSFDFAQAMGIVWAPNSQQIVFFAAPEARGSVRAQVNAKYNLYQMDLDTGDLRILIESVQHPRGTGWSPNGRWLAFQASIRKGLTNKEGIWVFDMVDDTTYFISEGEHGTPTWSSDGLQLAAIKYSVDTPPLENKIVLIDVSQLIGED